MKRRTPHHACFLPCLGQVLFGVPGEFEEQSADDDGGPVLLHFGDPILVVKNAKGVLGYLDIIAVVSRRSG